MNPYYPHLLKPLQVGNVILKNRMICPPSQPYNAQANETWPSDTLIECYAERARGGAAIVTCDGSGFGKIWPGGNGWDASDLGAKNYMAQMVDAVHFYGARAHGTCMTFPPEVSTEDFESLNITTEKIYECVEHFSELAKNISEAGFDGIYIHMSYRMVLTGKLLSPISNHRTDEFGGSFENRIRFPLMLCRRIKEKCGKDFMIEACITGHEIEEGGWTLDDTVAFAKAAEGLIDILTLRSYEIDHQHPIGYLKERTPFLYMAEYVKKAGVKQAVAASAGFIDPDDCEAAVREGKADLISMARAYISNSNFGQLLYEGRAEDLVPCLRCNKCHQPNHCLSVCVVNPRFASEKTIDRRTVPFTREKKIAIIGGGPSGMEAALIAAERGHKVTLFEKKGRLGGMLEHSRYATFKWPVLNWLKHYEKKLAENPNVTVQLNCAPDPDWLEAQNFDAVVAAVGGKGIVPKIPGIEAAIPAVDTFAHPELVGETAVIIGGGEIGVEAGMYLAQQGKKVTVIEMKDMIAKESFRGHYYSMFLEAVEAEKENLEVILKATCTEVSENSVAYKDENGDIHTIPCDTVLLAAGMTADVTAAAAYMNCGKQFYTIGDCRQIGSMQTAIRTGYSIGSAL